MNELIDRACARLRQLYFYLIVFVIVRNVGV